MKLKEAVEVAKKSQKPGITIVNNSVKQVGHDERVLVHLRIQQLTLTLWVYKVDACLFNGDSFTPSPSDFFKRIIDLLKPHASTIADALGKESTVYNLLVSTIWKLEKGAIVNNLDGAIDIWLQLKNFYNCSV